MSVTSLFGIARTNMVFSAMVTLDTSHRISVGTLADSISNPTI